MADNLSADVMAWTPEKRKALSDRMKAEYLASAPDGVGVTAAEAPAAAWVQCIMPQLLKDAQALSEEREGSTFNATLVLLAICLRGTLDVPFLRAVTGLPYHDILVMAVRLKLGGLVQDDDTPNLAALINESDPATESVQTALATGLMRGTFRRTPDDRWRLGDHGDLDGNAAQHMLNDILAAA